ncbi:class I SAM-dependent methyltransferase [Terrabacter sp. 2RAF25]|uniref:class I SAM-dependent methyltransferase n=1 Tax=Terrabacter sp. 2RAF25 TaxID=3232998 RepID=UPI003F97B4B7
MSGAEGSSEFDREYWERHWEEGPPGEAAAPANPHLVREAGALSPGTALDAGCGEGGEARWLAAHGWEVTAVDISAEALVRAVAHERAGGGDARVEWVGADLTTWKPGRQFHLVTTSYAHPTIPQLDLYDRIAAWVAPGGSLLVVGHLHQSGSHGGGAGNDEGHGHGHGPGHGPGHGHGHVRADDEQPPEHATVTLADITARLDPAEWEVQTASEHTRTSGRGTPLHDVVVRARRRA